MAVTMSNVLAEVYFKVPLFPTFFFNFFTTDRTSKINMSHITCSYSQKSAFSDPDRIVNINSQEKKPAVKLKQTKMTAFLSKNK